MNNPKISVLIPAYNHENYIKDCIDSVLNQTFTNFELLITDDCSKDNTVQIIKSYSDERITGIFFDENRGTVRSLNHLLSMAKGEYIAVLGSDDVWEPDKLEKQLEVMERDSDLAACFCWATIIDQDSNIIDSDPEFPIHIFNCEDCDREQMLREFYVSGNHFCHSSVLIRKDVHDKIGKYNPAYRQLHDFDLWVRLLLQYNVAMVKEPLVKYRFIKSSGNLSESSVENNFRLFNEAENIISFLFDNISSKDFLKAFEQDFIATKVSTEEQINCEKFLMLKERKLWIANNTSLAMGFLMRHLDEDMLSCFENEYGISLKQLYDYTAMFRAACHADVYSELKVLSKEIAKLAEDIRYLQAEKEEIFNSTSWKITKPIRYIMNKLRRVRGS